MIQDNGILWVQQMDMLRSWISKGLLPEISGRVIWDLGAGDGEYSAAMLDLGAAHVLSTDIKRTKMFDHNLSRYRNNTFVLGNIDECVDNFKLLGLPAPEVVFMSLMTEHVYDIRTFLQRLSERVPAGTRLFILHDNYYNPMGHHDHKFLMLNSDWNVQRRAAPCWELPEKCAATAEDRRRADYLWSPTSDATRNPENCTSCNFYRRSQPWAHLAPANEFARLFPEPFFHGSLNKVTVTQLALYLVDNGFTIHREHRSWVTNIPPEHLVKDYGLHNVTVFNYLVAAVRR